MPGVYGLMGLLLSALLVGCGEPAPEPAVPSQPLPEGQAHEALTQLDNVQFATAVAEGVSLVDFYADNCPPCHTMLPVVHGLARELRGSLRVYRVDADTARDLAEAQQIEVLPTFIIYKQGRAVARHEGALPAEEFRTWLDENR